MRYYNCANCGFKSENILDFRYSPGDNYYDENCGLRFNDGKRYCNKCADKFFNSK
jgi:hypothetical protein